MFVNTIRSKLFVTFGTLTACICLIFTGLTWLFSAVTEDDVLKQIMVTEARYIQNHYLNTQKLTSPRADYFALYASKSELPANIYEGYLDNPYEKEFYINGRNYHIDEYELNENQTFWLTLDASELGAIEEISGPMLWSLLAFSIFTFVCALWTAWILSNRTARPIEQLTQEVIDQNKEKQFTLPEPKRVDEIGQLGRAFKQTLDSLASSLEREVNFTRDVSHELRTPITLLRNTITLAGKKPLTEQDKLLINQVSEDLKSTVDVLLALARSENLTKETLHINSIIERSILALHTNNPEASFDVHLEIDSSFKLCSNPYLVSLLCQNLINNGFYHGGAGTMRIYNKDKVLIFENEIRENHNLSYQGLGHGQYLVSRISENLSWSIQILKDDKHYRVEVTTQSAD